jgi:hypothetical protein
MIRSIVLGACLLLLTQPAAGQGIFRDTVPLEVTLVTDLRTVLRDRDSTRFKPHPAQLTYKLPDGTLKTFPVTLRARGHFRRQARNCSFPPLKLEFKRADARETLFQGNSNMKITTTCQPGNSDYEQYVLGEYAIYRAYQIVSPRYFRTRLAKITYHDNAGKENDVVSWAFFVEDDKEVAKKFGLVVQETQGALFHDLDAEQLAITSLFEYFAANTDWSISALHNIALMRDSIGTLYPIAFDFDWGGAVNARYAFPDARLNIRTTTTRLYRGPCLKPEDWQPTFARFTAARPRIEAMYNAVPGMDPRRLRTTLAFFAEFHQTIADPKKAREAMTNGCSDKGN